MPSAARRAQLARAALPILLSVALGLTVGAWAGLASRNKSASAPGDDGAGARWEAALTRLEAGGSFAWTSSGNWAGGTLTAQQRGNQDLVAGRWQSDNEVTELRQESRTPTRHASRLIGVDEWAYRTELDANGRPRVPWVRFPDAHIYGERTQHFELGRGAKALLTILLEHVNPEVVTERPGGAQIGGTVPLAWATKASSATVGLFPQDEGRFRAAEFAGTVPVVVDLDPSGLPLHLTLDWKRMRDDSGELKADLVSRMRLIRFTTDFTDHGRPIDPVAPPPPNEWRTPNLPPLPAAPA